MRYLRWLAARLIPDGMTSFMTEVDDNGYVDRELGFDSQGRVVHRKPSANFARGDFGYFDSPPMEFDEPVQSGAAVEVARDVFEAEWSKPDVILDHEQSRLERLRIAVWLHLGRIRSRK